MEFWWLEIINRTLKTTITLKLVVFYICCNWPSWKILQLTFQTVALSHEELTPEYVSFQWICYLRWPTRVIDSIIISNFLNNYPTEVATARHGFFRNCSLCQPWPEARVEMALSGTKLHWVVVMPLNDDGIMTPLIQLQRVCVYGWMVRLLNNMNPLISAPPKRIRSRIILEVM